MTTFTRSGDHRASVTSDDLDAERVSPWVPHHRQSVRSCLHVILDEEWDHYRYAVRDLGAMYGDTL